MILNEEILEPNPSIEDNSPQELLQKGHHSIDAVMKNIQDIARQIKIETDKDIDIISIIQECENKGEFILASQILDAYKYKLNLDAVLKLSQLLPSPILGTLIESFKLAKDGILLTNLVEAYWSTKPFMFKRVEQIYKNLFAECTIHNLELAKLDTNTFIKRVGLGVINYCRYPYLNACYPFELGLILRFNPSINLFNGIKDLAYAYELSRLKYAYTLVKFNCIEESIIPLNYGTFIFEPIAQKEFDEVYAKLLTIPIQQRLAVTTKLVAYINSNKGKLDEIEYTKYVKQLVTTINDNN